MLMSKCTPPISSCRLSFVFHAIILPVLLDWSLGFDVNLAKTLVCGVTGPISGSSVGPLVPYNIYHPISYIVHHLNHEWMGGRSGIRVPALHSIFEKWSRMSTMDWKTAGWTGILPGQLLNWSCCLDHPGSGAWNSWACPGLITLNSTLASQMFLYHNYLSYVQVCRRPGDPNKLMFCKRCDGAYHCYCQQPSHKVHLHPPFSIVLIYGSYLSTAQHVMFQNVTHGPYLCPKHTRCHSCGSGVPGSGHSTRYWFKQLIIILFIFLASHDHQLSNAFSATLWTWIYRWFLGYTCCDACGRLFVKGNYCPVCLKVTPSEFLIVDIVTSMMASPVT